MQIKSELEKAARYWSTRSRAERIGWWYNDEVLQHINKIVCGQAILGPWAGLQQKMINTHPEGLFENGISIGCGEGIKELELLKNGIVQTFELYELSKSRVETGIELAKRMGLSHRAFFHIENAFDRRLPASSFDLVYWNNSLHHMLDVDVAIRWSHSRLKLGGHFVMDDYVGPSRFQSTTLQLVIATIIRLLLPRRLLTHPKNERKTVSRIVVRPKVKWMIETDPTEAADSGNIIPSLKRIFPGAEIIPTGGLVYFLSLNPILQNFDAQKDRKLLDFLLRLDEILAHYYSTEYAVAIAVKR